MKSTKILSALLLTILLAASLATPRAHADITLETQLYKDYFTTNKVDYNRSLHLFGPDHAPTAAFIAARSGVGLDRIHISYKSFKGDWLRVMTGVGLQPDILFIPVPDNYQVGPPYGNAYGYWKKRGKNPKYHYVLTPREVNDLVQLNIIHRYYGIPAVDVIRYRTEGKPLHWIIRTENEKKIKMKNEAKQYKEEAKQYKEEMKQHKKSQKQNKKKK